MVYDTERVYAAMLNRREAALRGAALVRRAHEFDEPALSVQTFRQESLISEALGKKALGRSPMETARCCGSVTSVPK